MAGAQSASRIYDQLLTAIGGRADEIGDRPIVTHWPHVGSAYHGLVILGQALYGWPDDFSAAQFRTPAGRAEALRVTRGRNADRKDPLDWIATNPVRSSPWSTARKLAEALEPGTVAPWYARIAWVNLYPAAPERPPGNPSGPLREAQDPLVGDLLRATIEILQAQTIVALVGPFWWPAGSSNYFAVLKDQPRPLLRAGVIDERRWIVGSHPAGRAAWLGPGCLRGSPTGNGRASSLQRTSRRLNRRTRLSSAEDRLPKTCQLNRLVRSDLRQ